MASSVALENKAARGVKIFRLFGVNYHIPIETHSDSGHLVKKPKHSPIDQNYQEEEQNKIIMLCDSGHHLVKKPKHSPTDDQSQEKEQNQIIIEAQPISYFNPNTQIVVAMDFPTPPPSPPKLTQQQMLDHIEKSLGGTEIKLVIQKRLVLCDLKAQQGRLSMPRKHIKEEFLWENEKEWLNAEPIMTNNKNSMPVCVIGSRGGVYNLCLTKWDYSSSNPKDGNTNVVGVQQKRKRQPSSTGPGCSYVLLSGLKKLRKHTDLQIKKHKKQKEENPLTKLLKENDAKVDEVVQIFSFRKDEKLCFAIVS